MHAHSHAYPHLPPHLHPHLRPHLRPHFRPHLRPHFRPLPAHNAGISSRGTLISSRATARCRRANGPRRRWRRLSCRRAWSLSTPTPPPSSASSGACTPRPASRLASRLASRRISPHLAPRSAFAHLHSPSLAFAHLLPLLPPQPHRPSRPRAHCRMPLGRRQRRRRRRAPHCPRGFARAPRPRSDARRVGMHLLVSPCTSLYLALGAMHAESVCTSLHLPASSLYSLCSLYLPASELTKFPPLTCTPPYAPLSPQGEVSELANVPRGAAATPSGAVSAPRSHIDFSLAPSPPQPPSSLPSRLCTLLTSSLSHYPYSHHPRVGRASTSSNAAASQSLSAARPRSRSSAG